MNEYDITATFKAIEDELIASMIRNMDHHRAEETKEGYEWSMWQAEQLKALEKYKKDNQKKYKKQFRSINGQIEELIRMSREEGNMQQELQILDAIRKGFKAQKISQGLAAEFFKLNDRKLEALIKATVDDMEKAETAILRKAEDDYRKAIFNAQVYANTGAGTYEKAVDMATKDMLSRGLNCIQYANGARHTLADYADMAIRTASKRAYLQGEGEKRQEWGVPTVIMTKRGNPCPKCVPFVGKVLIDDVWSGGAANGVDPETGKKYPLMSYAISCGLYHPRCRDSHSTYFPGISTADDTWTKKELESIGLNYDKEQKQQYAKRQAEKFGRLAEYSLDSENQKRYAARREEWKRRHAVFDTENTKAEINTTKSSGVDIQEQINDNIEQKLFNKGIQVNIEEAGKYHKEAFEALIHLDKLTDEYRSTAVSYAVRKTAGAQTEYGSAYTLNGKTAIVVDPRAHRVNKAIDARGLGEKQPLGTTYHEFAHSLSQSREKVDPEFWKEIRKIKREYEGIRGKSNWFDIKISDYASKDVDEFLAEAFTQAKLSDNPSSYSKRVLDVVDRYFKKPIAKASESGIMELQRKIDDSRGELKFISDETFDNLTITARKKGAVIIRGTEDAEEHLKKQGAAAANIGDVLIFRKNVCISEVLEETYHFEQNILKMNDDKKEPLRSILNEIDAKRYLLKNADKYKIPRNEIELTQRQLESYQQQLEEYGEDMK